MIARDRGDVDAAYSSLSAIRDKSAQLGFKGTAVNIAVELAQIDMGRNDWVKARDELTDLVYRTEKDPEATEVSLLALCYAKSGNIKERDATLRRALALRVGTTLRRRIFAAKLALAQVENAGAGPLRAADRLLEIADEAERRFWIANALEARLVAWQLLANANDSRAEPLRTSIESSARQHGFGWILARLDRKP